MEAQYQITLPAEYRTFLSEVGSGRAGPFYGLLPPDGWGDVLDDLGVERGRSAVSEPCLLRPGLGEEGDGWMGTLGVPDWEARFEAETWSPFAGTLALSHQGCTFYSLLVLNGPHRGRVCNIDLDYQPPSFSPQPTFLHWYEDWLHGALAGRGEEISFAYARSSTNGGLGA